MIHVYFPVTQPNDSSKKQNKANKKTLSESVLNPRISIKYNLWNIKYNTQCWLSSLYNSYSTNVLQE